MALIEKLAPQMEAYKKQFHTDGQVEWQPYVMFFHPKNYHSAVANTDRAGFRFSERNGSTYSVATAAELPSARLLAGNSVAFGIGATSDRATLPSRLMVHDRRETPWLNFAGRAFNSAQELILLTLYRHMLPKIDEIVLLSGANNLFLARLPEEHIQEHGAFYNSGRFFEMIQQSADSDPPGSPLAKLFGKRAVPSYPKDNTWSLDERIAFAAELTLRHLDGWSAVARDLGAKLTFVLQPVSRWVREKGCSQEEALFQELANLARYTTVHEDVLHRAAGARYASVLAEGARKRGISFVDISPRVHSSINEDEWIFIDHTHLTDLGYDLAARLLLDITA